MCAARPETECAGRTGVLYVQAQQVAAGGLLLAGKVKCAGRMEGEREPEGRWGLRSVWPEP